MSTTKDITMKQFNGIDYDTLYPKNTSQQVLLNDSDLADSLGLTNTDPTVNDALGAITDGTYETLPVGTVIETLRTDLGDNWVLTNGESLSGIDYPELYEIAINTNEIGTHLGTIVGEIPGYYSLTGATVINFTKNINGYYFICGRDTNGYVWLMYATDPTESWTTVTIDSTNVFYPTDIIYGNGYWVISGSRRVGAYPGPYTSYTSTTDLCIYYATSLNGTWTLNTSISDDSTVYVNGGYSSLAYGNGVFYICVPGEFGSSAEYIYYANTFIFASSDPSVSWTKFLYVSYATGGAIYYNETDSRLMLFCVTSSNSTSKLHYVLSIDPTATPDDSSINNWPRFKINTILVTNTTTTSSVAIYPRKILKLTDYIFVTVSGYVNTGGQNVMVYNSSDNSIILTSFTSSADSLYGILDAIKFNNHYYFGDVRVKYKDETTIASTGYETVEIDNTSAYFLLFFTKNELLYVLYITRGRTDVNLYTARIDPATILPTLSTTDVYTYIKIQ